MQKKFTHAILGGTFDHFHAGHKHFLTAAISQTEYLEIGLTTEKLYGHKLFPYIIEHYPTREENIKNFIHSQNSSEKTNIIPLYNIYGNSLEKEDIDVIFVTPDTEKTAEKINQERQQKGWKPMQIIVVPLKKGTDGNVIASARIRKGEIDREGNTYLSLFLYKNVYSLPELLRNTLRIPLGEVIEIKSEIITLLENKTIISIGDIMTVSLQKIGIQPAISIFDFRSEREEIIDKNIIDKLPTPQHTGENKPGTIQKDVVVTLQKALDVYLQTNEKQSISIQGEEDLLTLPSVLLSPLQAIVLYGQKDIGAIAITVTEEKKQHIKKLIEQFV